MRAFAKLSSVLLAVLFIFSCQDDNPAKQNTTGFLKLGLTLTIEKTSMGGRTSAVNTDNFIVTIFRADGSIHSVIDPFSSAPEEIELETGEYYVEANSNNSANAAFENPFYSGRSENFTIDKEETKTVTVNCSLANCKISFEYSENVLATFSDWMAKATLINEGDFLEWPKGEDREGYFTLSPISINVSLFYQKQFSSEVITKSFSANIDDPQPRTHYKIHVDAELIDGKISLIINVDEGVEVVDIELGENTPLTGPFLISELPGGATFASSGSPLITGTRNWDFSNVVLANSKNVYWGLAPDGIKASMDGNGYDDVSLNEVLDFVPGESNLAGGLLVWRGTTRLSNGTNVQTKFTMNITDNGTSMPIALIDAASLGLAPSVGGVAKFNNSAQQIRASFSLTASVGGSFMSFSYIYDTYKPLSEIGGLAFSSFQGGFYH